MENTQHTLPKIHQIKNEHHRAKIDWLELFFKKGGKNKKSNPNEYVQ